MDNSGPFETGLREEGAERDLVILSHAETEDKKKRSQISIKRKQEKSVSNEEQI